MTETLLSTSNILLFGRKVEDLAIRSSLQADLTLVRAATIGNIARSGAPVVDGVKLVVNDFVLVKNQDEPLHDGIYKVKSGNWNDPDKPAVGSVISVAEGRVNGDTFWRVTDATDGVLQFVRVSSSGNLRFGANKQLEAQLEGAGFARIYGFSYDGAYYDLPRPALFLVHGEGADAVLPSKGGGGADDANLARAPRQPSLSGVGAADIQLADGLKVWSYDKADYTIRMDVETGMFEQVLLDIFFDGGGGVSGARVSGARVSGARVSGARVSGARVSGARVGGPRGDASD